MVKGDKFEKALIQWKDHVLDKNWSVVKGKEPWHPFGGLRYYGFWPIKALYSYRFQWTGVAENGEVQFHPKEWLDYILLKDDVYWAKVEKAEDKKLLPLEIEVVLTIRVINPYKNLFAVQNWLETIINRTKPAVRDAITRKEYAELIKDKEAVGREIYKIIKERKLLKEFKSRYGVKVREIEVKEINPPKDYREDTLKKYRAEREKERIIIEADAERQRLETVAEGEKLRIKAVYKEVQKFGNLGKLVRALEAMEKSPLAASMTVHSIPGLQEVLKGVFGRTSEKISAKEIKVLKEMAKKLSGTKKRRKKGS